MKLSSILKQTIQEETDTLRELFYSKFESVWNELEFIKRLSKGIPTEELGRLSLWWLYCFAAQIAMENGATKGEFIVAMQAAYEEVEEENNDEGDEEDEDEEDDDDFSNPHKGHGGTRITATSLTNPPTPSVVPLSVPSPYVSIDKFPHLKHVIDLVNKPASGSMTSEKGFDEKPDKEIDPESFANED